MTTEPTLLDVNLLIALAWPNHVHHRAARAWFAERAGASWATTPITEAGFVRVSSNRNVVPTAGSPQTALRVFGKLCSLDGHEFWPDNARLLTPPVDLTGLATARQVTDIHLVSVAVMNKGRLATFDRGLASLLQPDDRVFLELLDPSVGS